jgi:hypothetical protein
MGFPSLFFFGGLSMHLTTALLAHMFSYNITWGATKKVCAFVQTYPRYFADESFQEVERSNFWIEVPRIWKRYWPVLIFSFLTIAAVVVLSTTLVPPGFRVPGSGWAIIMPLVYVHIFKVWNQTKYLFFPSIASLQVVTSCSRYVDPFLE